MNEFGNLILFLGQLTDPVGIASADGSVVTVNEATAKLVRIAHASETNFADYLDVADRDRLSRLCTLSTDARAREVGPIAIRVSVTYRSVSQELWVSATPLLEPATKPSDEPRSERILLLFRRVVAESDDAASQTRQHPGEKPSTQHGPVDVHREVLDSSSGCAKPVFTQSESAVLLHTLEGNRIQTTAAQLFMSEHTVRNTLKRINRKVGVHSIAELRETLCPANSEKRPQPVTQVPTGVVTTPVWSISSFRGAHQANRRPIFGTPASSDSEPCSH
jgi:DNA-binding CsgD family transcriptional regulator